MKLRNKIINELHTTVVSGIWTLGKKQPPTNVSPYSAGIRDQHRCTPGEIDALAEAHINVAKDGLALHVAFPSLYEHVGNRNYGCRLGIVLLLLLLLLLPLPLMVINTATITDTINTTLLLLPLRLLLLNDKSKSLTRK